MSRIPLVASAEDLPDAIQFAQRNPTARWFVAGRAATFQHIDDIPDDWAEKAPITASLQAPKVSETEKEKIDADVADGHEENLPSAIVDPDNDGDDDLVASKDTDHDGAAYRKKLGLKADSAPGEEDDEDPEEDEDDGLTAAIDYEALVAAGYYRDYGIEDDYDNFDVDSEMPLTASGQVIIADAFTAEQRQQYAKSKIALPDGSFPIPNKRYLAKAIRAVGRASNNSKGTVRKHIVKRAKALGASYMLPDSYNGVTAAAPQTDAIAIAKNLLRSQAGLTAAAEDREAKKAALRESVNLGKAEAPEGAIAAASKVIKDVEHDFDEALHPRGKDGKFITKGGRVIADDGAGHRVEGTVEAIHAGLGGGAQIQIKTDQGHSIITSPNHVVNAPTAVAHLGEAQPPHANPTTATEHIDNAQFHINEANKHLASAERARSDTSITKHQKLAAEHMTAAKAHRDAATEMVHNSDEAERTGHIGNASMDDLASRRTTSQLHNIASYNRSTPEAQAAHAEIKRRIKDESLPIEDRREAFKAHNRITSTQDFHGAIVGDDGPEQLRKGETVENSVGQHFQVVKHTGNNVSVKMPSGVQVQVSRSSVRRLQEAKGETTGVKGMSDEDLQGLVDKYGSDSRIGTRAKAELDSRPGTPLGRKRAAEAEASPSGIAPAHTMQPQGTAHREPINSATLRLHPGTYRSQPGHTITGKDTKGRRVNVFVPGERGDAEKARDNIKAGRSAFEDAPAIAPTKEHPAKILGPEGTYDAKADVKANYPGRDDLPGATPATPKFKTDADYTNAAKAEHAKSDAEVAKDMVSPDAFTRRQAAEVQTERQLAANKALDLSKQANAASAKANATGSTDDHRTAADKHIAAAQEHDRSKSDMGKRIAATHRSVAQKHKDKVPASFAPPSNHLSELLATKTAPGSIAEGLQNRAKTNHQEQVVEQLKRMGYTERTAKGARNLTSKDKATRIKVNSDGSFGLKVNRGDGVYSARNHSVDTSGDAHSVAQALHETGKAAPPVKPHKSNASEDNVLQARKEVIRRGLNSTDKASDVTRPVPKAGAAHVESDARADAAQARMDARRAAARAVAGKSRKSTHALQVDKEVSRQLGDEKPAAATKDVEKATEAKKLTTNTESKPLYKLTNQDIEHEISVATQRGDSSRANTLKTELVQRKAKIKEVLGQAKSAKAYIKEELPKLGETPTKNEENRFFRGLYKIMPILKPKIEKIRESHKLQAVKDVDYFGAVVDSVFQTFADHIVGGLITGAFSTIGLGGVSFLTARAGG